VTFETLLWAHRDKTMLRKLGPILALSAAIGMPISTHAQELIESYTALLSEADHFNSNGQRLTSAAAIIRQDRANYYRYGVRDADDQGDGFFADEGNRAVRLEGETQQSLSAAHTLSQELHVAKDRIAKLEAEVQLYREKAERAQGWLEKIASEVEDRLIKQPEVRRRLQ
jgi:hypothetical protein